MSLALSLISPVMASSSFTLHHFQILLTASAILLLIGSVLAIAVWKPKLLPTFQSSISCYYRFFYASFLKPHSADPLSGQQGALESFYKAQADVYDATRKRLLCGREDMLGLVAAQLKYKVENGAWPDTSPTWVDIGGGTGWNIEAMQAFVNVPTFFSCVYLVDLSPSLCEVAQKRFARLGWTNVRIICMDARLFSLKFRADLITMSYSLSMIPDYYSVVDSITSLLDPNGLIGVIDFYVQSVVETSGRNYTGGSIQRHVNWVGRSFWRAWFDLDRVGLEGAKRDYLEYKFGTLKCIDDRNYLFGGIPYYIFLGCHASSTTTNGDLIERVDAAITESPYLSPRQHRLQTSHDVENAAVSIRSKAYQSAVVNLSANLPLPSTFYQNKHHRIHYDDNLQKHTQFKNDFIYAFTWEDSRVDQRLLKINQDDVILCLTSAGDNLLDYLISANPRRIHAVDLNPSQNHLLELKVAAYQALPYLDFWKLFGEGRYPAFRSILVNRLSPYMSSQACQFFLTHTDIFTSSKGLYERGGSGHAIRLVRWLLWICGLKSAVGSVCEAKTLNEQREIWPKIRGVLMSRALHWVFLGTKFLWKAAGVPPAQIAMILQDYVDQETLDPMSVHLGDASGEAMWQYFNNTLDPIARETLLSEENFYYLLCLNGKYTRRCHPNYLTPKAHAKLSRPGAFDGLRIHTDEIKEVISRLTPGTLTIAIVMDSMDWFDPSGDEAAIQVRALNHALKISGRVMLRSAGLKPWYVSVFESLGFTPRRVGARLPGMCIDRVNMYASMWIMTKSTDLMIPERSDSRDSIEPLRSLSRDTMGEPAI